MPDIFVAEPESSNEPTRYGRVSDTDQPESQTTTPSTPEYPSNPLPPTPPVYTPPTTPVEPPSFQPLQTEPAQPMPEIEVNDVDTPSPLGEQFHTPDMTQGAQANMSQENTFPVMPNYNLVHESHTSSIPLFTSFWQNPTGVYFDTQGAHEQILIFLRKHFITNVPWLASVTFFIIAPFGIQFALQYEHVNLALFNVFTQSQIRVALTFYLILIFTYAFIKFLSWYYNISLITQERVLDIELEDLVNKRVAATKISLVQDITYQQSGAIGSLLDFGDVLIQTAGTQDNFIINSVPRPELVIKIVEDIIGRERTPFSPGV